MRASEIGQRPVVTMAGDDVAQVKDIVYAPDGGAVVGFTLAGRGRFAGPLKQALPWRSVVALGSGAVMIADEGVLEPTGEVLGSGPSRGPGGDIMGSRVLTDGGTDLGHVIDVIIEVDSTGGRECDVVGYEIEASASLDQKGTHLLIPLPDTLAASREHLMVPESARNFVGQDLAGFGASVEAFRAQLAGPS